MKMKLISTLLVCSIVPLGAQNQKDPYKKGEKKEEVNPNLYNESKAYNIVHEVFSLPLKEAAEIQRKNLTDEELYKHLVEKADLNDFTMFRVLPSQRVSSQGVAEFIYPTEFEPPELPNVVGVRVSEPITKGSIPKPPEVEKLENAPKIGQLSELKTPANPTAFETRNLGLAIQVQLTPQKNGLFHVSVNTELVKLGGRTVWGQGVSQVEMPKIESMNLSVSTVTKLDTPCLLGTMRDKTEKSEKIVKFTVINVKPMKE